MWRGGTQSPKPIEGLLVNDSYQERVVLVLRMWPLVGQLLQLLALSPQVYGQQILDLMGY